MKESFYLAAILILTSCTHHSDANKNKLAGNFDTLKKETTAKIHVVINKYQLIQDTKIKTSDYALCYWIDDSLYLYGKYPMDMTITLFNHKNEIQFESVTKTYKVTDDIINGDIVITGLSSQPEIKNLKSFEYGIFLKKSLNYSIIKPTDITGIQIENIDSTIRKTNLLGLLLEQNGQKQSVEITIGNSFPEIKSFIVDTSSLLIMAYKHYDKPNGPRIGLYKNKLFPLTGQCSFKDAFVYRFNSRYFLQTGSWCCGCGYNVFQIFEITKQDIIPIYNDDSFAN